MRVLVLMGGVSPERDVSLDSGAAIAGALEQTGHRVVALDTGANAKLPESHAKAVTSAVRPEPPDVRKLAELDKQVTLRSVNDVDLTEVDVVFVALHGGSGENGVIQALLELTGVPYTGSGVLASALAMDKDKSKKIFEREKIPTPQWMVIETKTDGNYEDCLPDIVNTFAYPLVVKPSDGGSTIGLTIVKSKEELAPALRLAGELTDRIMVEEFIPGRELTVAVLGDKALPVVEIIPSHEYYDYECKYLPGMTEYVVPAEIDEQLTARLQELGLRAYRALGCAGYARVDFRSDSNGNPHCLEVNTLPGMTTTSLVPKAAKAAGITFELLVDTICKDAASRARK
ncbi:MAG: D-alanine--D-alanine ligase [candidate division Zixibacteria bacterium]|nr:D-alanine--D-alanine ligase [candidate division Zixibacteria bacterium]